MPRLNHEQLKHQVREIQKTIAEDLAFPTIPGRAIPDRSNSIATFVDGDLYTEYNNRIYRVTK